MRSTGYVTALLCLIVGCSNIPNNPQTATGRCDELGGGTYVPITLGQILCIAKESAGTIFLVDQTDTSGSTIRCFISGSNEFHRVEVLGSSVRQLGFYSITLGDSAHSVFQFSYDNGVWRMATMISGQPPNLTIKTLFILDRSELPDYPILNFPPAVFIEYLARDSVGNYLLATRPKYDWDGMIVIHYGTPRAMVKEPVTGMARSSTSTSILFSINGDSAIADFEGVFSNGMFDPGPAYLQVNGVKRTLEILKPDEQTVRLLGFDCWEEMSCYQ